MECSVQAKLLRVIQERKFNLVGGQKTIKVAVRIIAAINRKLKDEIKKRKFQGRPFLPFKCRHC